MTRDHKPPMVAVCEHNNRSIADLLIAKGWRVKRFNEKDEALNWLSSNYPDAVVIEQSFDRDGFVFCEALRQLRGYVDKPLLMLIADMLPATIEALKNCTSLEFEILGENLLPIELRLSRMISVSDNKPSVNHTSPDKVISLTDRLTGLYNQQYFRQALSKKLKSMGKERESGALMLLDINEFKRINSSFDYQTGDYLLKIIAERLLMVVRDSDILVREANGTLLERLITRHGGDEFTLFIDGVNDSPILLAIAHRLLKAISEPIWIAEHKFVVSACIGIALLDAGVGIDTLLCNAEQAMYEAKKSQNDRVVFFSADMESSAKARFAIESDMREALERGEFSLHYQPQVESASGKVSRMEALCRWTHPEHGPISPVDFIPVAEKSGLILALGNWVILEACRQIRQWLDNGIACEKIAVNVSACQFFSADFVPTIERSLDTYRLPGKYLELELTESIFIQDIEQNICKLQKLKSLGITLAVDDFGTGYSSLGYLKRLPIDIIKIEKSFISQINIHSTEEAIVDAILALAQRLDFKVVAEGVEDITQLEYLQNKGCDFLQGFLLGKPVAHNSAWNPVHLSQLSKTA